MSNHCHLIMVIEDDEEIAEDLALKVAALGHQSITARSKAGALELIETHADDICLILLDLNILVERDSLKASTLAGRSLLLELRQQFPGRGENDRHLMPILIVSGHANEVDLAVQLVTRDGASDVIQKQNMETSLADKIQKHLTLSGRTQPGACSRITRTQRLQARRCMTLSIPGTRSRQRVDVEVNGERTGVTELCLRVLLHLIVGHLLQKPVLNSELGSTSPEQGSKDIATLKNQLAKVLGERVLYVSHHHGRYSLPEDTVIGEINREVLLATGENKIVALAETLGTLLAAAAK